MSKQISYLINNNDNNNINNSNNNSEKCCIRLSIELREGIAHTYLKSGLGGEAGKSASG